MEFKFGVILKDDLINRANPFQIDDDERTEDLFLLSYGDGKLGLDVGWYGCTDHGSFSIYIIEDCDWENPVLKVTDVSAQNLRYEFSKAVLTYNELCEKIEGNSSI